MAFGLHEAKNSDTARMRAVRTDRKMREQNFKLKTSIAIIELYLARDFKSLSQSVGFQQKATLQVTR